MSKKIWILVSCNVDDNDKLDFGKPLAATFDEKVARQVYKVFTKAPTGQALLSHDRADNDGVGLMASILEQVAMPVPTSAPSRPEVPEVPETPDPSLDRLGDMVAF